MSITLSLGIFSKIRTRLQENIPKFIYLLVEQLIVLSFELLNDVLVIKQFFDGAVGFAEQVLYRGAAMLAVSLPEVAV